MPLENTRTEGLARGRMKCTPDFWSDSVAARCLGVQTVRAMGTHRPLHAHDIEQTFGDLGYARGFWMGQDLRNPLNA